MRKHILHKVLLLLVGLASLGLFLLSSGTANAANPTTLNFQGKVVNADGTNVTSTTYPFVFRIYNTPTPTTATACSSDAACLYEETQASVQVTNGVFQVELGSGCTGGLVASNTCTKSVAGGLNFNTNNALYLVLKFNNDAAGFMSNPIHLTSVPYAFYADNAGSLGGIAAGNFVQLAQGLQTDSSTTNASIAINKTGSTANILTLQKSSTSVLTLDNNGLLNIQPAASLTAGQTHVAQSFTNASSTGGTVNGYNQTITVANTASASTTNGFNIAATDNTSGISNISNGVKITLSGSSTQQQQVGVNITVNHGYGINSVSNGTGLNGSQDSVGVYGSGKATSGQKAYGGFFYIDSASTATSGAALYASNSTATTNILDLQDNTTSVFTVADGGLISLQPAVALTGTGTQNNISQTLSNNQTAGTVNGYNQSITVSNASGTTTTNGFNINLTDATGLANTNVGINLKINNFSATETELGIRADVDGGGGILAISRGVATTPSCAGSSSWSYGVCGASVITAGGTQKGTGVIAVTSNARSTLTGTGGFGEEGLLGYSSATTTAGNFTVGAKGITNGTGTAGTNIGVYGEGNAGAGATVYGGYFNLGTGGATAGAALYATNSTVAANILDLQDNTTSVFTVGDGGLITMQPAAPLTGTGTQSNISQTLNNAQTAGTVNGYIQQITVQNASGTTSTNGLNLSISDNTSFANTNTGIKIGLNGSNTSQQQIGADISVNSGVGINARSSAGSTNNSNCGGTAYAASIGICGYSSATGNSGTATGSGVLGVSKSANTTSFNSSLAAGAGTVGYNAATGTAGDFYTGVRGVATQSASAAYSSTGVYGQGNGGNGATVYGGYFTLQGSSATLGSALYASNDTVAANILDLQDNTTSVFTVGDGGLITATSNSSAGLVVKNSSSSKTVLTVDTSANKLVLGQAGASGVDGTMIFQNSAGSNTVGFSLQANPVSSYTLLLPTTGPSVTQCLQTDGTVANQLVFAACSTGGSGATSVAYSTTPNSNGGSITGSVLTLAKANGSNPGLLSADAQTIGGDKTFNGFVKIAGSGTRPGSPTAGTLYYDTTTNQLIQYNGSKWVSDRNTATKIVAMGSPAGCTGTVPAASQSPDGADYVVNSCTDAAGATNGSTANTINAALTAVGNAGGGIVYLEEGTYIVSGNAITIPNKVTLAGSGPGTVIEFADGVGSGTYYAVTNSDTTNGTHVNIQNLTVDGNRSNQFSGTFYGIYFNGVGSVSGSGNTGGQIRNVSLENIALNAISLVNSSNNSISNNSFWFAYRAITLDTSNNNVIDSNEVSGSGAVGFAVSNSSNNTISGNTVVDQPGADLYNSYNNTVSGNTFVGTSSTPLGIEASSSGNTVVGNVIRGYINYGIYVQGATNNTISGNSFQADPSSNTKGVFLDGSSNNVVNGNKIHDNGNTSANNGIYLQNTSTKNSISSNDITDTSCSTTCYGINITDTGSTGNYLTANHFLGDGTHAASINDATTSGNTYANQSLTEKGDAIFRNATNSTTAFQLQNAAGSSVLSVDTTSLNNLLTNSSFENTDVSSWVYLGTPGSAARNTTQQYLGNASLKVITTANASNGVKYVTGASGLAISTTYTISWYDKLDSGSAALSDIRAVYARNGSSETACTVINTQTVISTSWTYHYCTIATDGTTPAAGAYIGIEQTAGAVHTFYLDGVQITATSAPVAYKETGINLQGTVTSNTIFSGLLSLQPAANLTAGQTELSQTLTNGSSTGGTVNGFSQTITVANTTSASTTNGFNISLTDNTALANTNNGIKISLTGSNNSQTQVGVNSSVALGTAIQATSTGSSGSSTTCGVVSGNIGVGVCSVASGSGGIGVIGQSNGSTSSILSYKGVGVLGTNNTTNPSAGQFITGVLGDSNPSGSNSAYTSTGVYGRGSATGSSGTAYGGYFTLQASTSNGSALYASNSSATENILQLQDGTTDVFTVGDGGLITMQPAASLTASSSNITQTLTNASSTATTINGYSQTITVSNSTTASTTNGFNISLTDNTALGNTNQGVNVNIAGSNTNQVAIGINSSVSIGAAIKGASSGGGGGTISCGSVNASSLGVCGIAQGSSGYGIVGVATNSATYAGYFTLSAGGSTGGSALYASNSTVAANILDLQDNTTSVFTVGDGGLVVASTNSASGFVVKDSSSTKQVLTIDTSGDQVLLGKAGASGLNGKLVFNNGTDASTAAITFTGNSTASYTYQLPTGTVGSNQCLQSGTVSGGTVPLTFAGCGGGGGTLASDYNGAATTGNNIILQSAGGGVLIQDNSTPLSAGTKLFAVQKSAGTVSYFAVTSTGINIQSNFTGSAVNALAFDTSTATPHLKVFDSGGSANYADIYYTGTTAVFGASTGTAVLGSGSGAVTVSAGTGSAFTITGDANSTISTTTGSITVSPTTSLTLQGGTTASLLSTTSSTVTVDSGTTGAVVIGGNSANGKNVAIGNNNSGTTVDIDGGTGATGIEIGNTSTAHGIEIGSNAAGVQTILIGNAVASSALTLNAGSGNLLINSTSGTITLQTTTAGAINIKPAAVDGTNIVLGTSDTVGNQLVLDTKSGSGDPTTGVNGGMYYNSNSGTFRCFQGSAWRNCLGGGPSNQSTATQAPSAGTDTYLTGSQIPLPAGGFRGPTGSGQDGSKITWRVVMTKTAAGTAASTFNIRVGTNGTTGDTLRCTAFSTGTATAVIDVATVIITVYATAGGSGTTLNCSATLTHATYNAATPAFIGWSNASAVQAFSTQASFDSTPAGTKIGLSFNGGTSLVSTIQSVDTNTSNL